MIENILLFVFIAVTIEGITFYFKSVCNNDFSRSCVASILLGIFVAVNFNIDFYSILDLQPTVPYTGNILTGILLSRGSNYIFDTVGVINENTVGKRTFY